MNCAEKLLEPTINKRCCFKKLFLVGTFSSMAKNGYFIMETDTFGYFVVWTIHKSHTDHFTPQHTALSTQQHAYQSFLSASWFFVLITIL